MLFHKYPLGRIEHLTQLTKLSGTVGDISRTTSGLSDVARASGKTSGLSDIRRVGGLDDLSITPPKSAYTSLPAGPQRRIAAGNEFSSRNIRTSDWDNKLQLKRDVRETARFLGDQKVVDTLTKQIDELESLTAIKKVDDIPTPELKNVVKSLDENPTALVDDLTPPSQSRFKSAAEEVIADMKKPGWKNKSPQEKWQSIKDFTKNNAKLIGFAALGITMSALYIKSQTDSNRINDTDYKIKRITSTEDTITVTYEPEDKFTKNDIITISDSNSTPKIDGDIQVTFTGKGVFRFKGNKLTTPGDSGKISVYTSVEDQFAQTVSDATSPVTQAVGQTVGSVVGSTLSELFDGLIPNDVKKFFSDYWIISLIICIIVCISSSISVILSYAK